MKLQVLILEDDLITSRDLTEVLTQNGMEVLGVAQSAEKARSLFLSQKPDVILVDIKLKGEEDGISFVKDFNSHHIPVVYLSANSDAETLKKAYATTPSSFLTKPFDEKDLRPDVQLTNWDSYWIDFYDDLELRPKYGWDAIENGMISFTQHPLRDELQKGFVDIMVDFSNDVYNNLNEKTQRNMIHIFGVDVIPDKDMKLWMLETNDNPHPTVVDDKRTPKIWPKPFKNMNYAQTLTESVMKELIEPMDNNFNNKLDKFEMIYEKQLKYNKWIFV